MTALLVAVVVALAVLVVFQGLVLLEVVRQLSQIRGELDFDNRPVPVSVGNLAGRPLPEPARTLFSENAASGDGVLVLLSTDCATCRLVAMGLPELFARFEENMVVVLQARNHDEVTELLAEAGVERDSVAVDLEHEYADAFGIALRPAAIVVRDGIVSEGAVVRNPRQLQQLLETVESSEHEAHDDLAVSIPTSGGVT
jgi:hypothetical protein